MAVLRHVPASTQGQNTRRGTGELKVGSLWALASILVVAVGGFVFWVAAAGTSANVDVVGRAAAWFTLMQLAVTVSALGAPILINRRGETPNAAYIAGMTVVSSLTAAALIGLCAPLLGGSSWKTLSGISGLQLGPLVALGVMGAAATLSVDARLVSLRRWRLLFLRAASPSVIRLPLLALDPLEDRATWLVLLSIGPLAISGFVGLVLMVIRKDFRLGSPTNLSSNDFRFLFTQHVSAVAAQAPYHALPLLVALRVAGPTNAAFYLIWSIGVMTAMIPQTLTQVLLSETSLEDTGRLQRIRLTLAANLGIAGTAWLASLVVAKPVLGLIGPNYADISRVLPWIVLASMAWGITSVCLTEARLAHDARTTGLIAWSLAITAIGLGIIVIPMRAVWGATFVWLGANLLAMVLGILSLERNNRVGTGHS